MGSFTKTLRSALPIAKTLRSNWLDEVSRVAVNSTDSSAKRIFSMMQLNAVGRKMGNNIRFGYQVRDGEPVRYDWQNAKSIIEKMLDQRLVAEGIEKRDDAYFRIAYAKFINDVVIHITEGRGPLEASFQNVNYGLYFYRMPF